MICYGPAGNGDGWEHQHPRVHWTCDGVLVHEQRIPRALMREDDADMFQLPTPPPGIVTPPISPFEQLVACIVLSVIAATLISFALPHPVFCKLFRIAFPFMPERLEDFDEK
jgi:hypothetical protein